MSDWNAGVIAEFRKNHGKVGGNFEGAPLLLINHKGARTGKPRTNPVMYLKDRHRYLVFASKGGADTNPDWYHNLVAHPDQVSVDLPARGTVRVSAEQLGGDRRDEAWQRMITAQPALRQI